MIANYVDDDFRALKLGNGELLDISKTKVAKSLFSFTMIPLNSFLHVETNDSRYELFLNVEMKFGQVLSRSTKSIRDIPGKWLVIQRELSKLSASEKYECLSLIQLYFEAFVDQMEKFICLYRLWNLTESIETESEVGGKILVKALEKIKHFVKLGDESCIAMLSLFKNEAAGTVLSKLMESICFDELDKVSKDFVEEMIISIVGFQWQLGRAKEPDDLLNDLLNCSLSYFHVSPNRVRILKLANTILTFGFIEFEGYTLDLLLDFCSHMHDPDLLDEMYDIVGSSTLKVRAENKTTLLSSIQSICEFNILPDTMVRKLLLGYRYIYIYYRI